MSDTVTISKKAPLRVATWSELEDRVPAYALALQTDLVVIRLGDEVSVLYGRCLHRGALMADGRIEDAEWFEDRAAAIVRDLTTRLDAR